MFACRPTVYVKLVFSIIDLKLFIANVVSLLVVLVL